MSHLHIPDFIAHLIGLPDKDELEKKWREAIHRSPNVAQESVKVLKDVKRIAQKSIDATTKIIDEHKCEKSEQLRVAEEAIKLLEQSKGQK